MRLRAGMQYKTFHGLEPLAGPAAERAPVARPAHGAGAAAAATLPDMRAHRCAGGTMSSQKAFASLAGGMQIMSMWVAAPAH